MYCTRLGILYLIVLVGLVMAKLDAKTDTPAPNTAYTNLEDYYFWPAQDTQGTASSFQKADRHWFWLQEDTPDNDGDWVLKANISFDNPQPIRSATYLNAQDAYLTVTYSKASATAFRVFSYQEDSSPKQLLEDLAVVARHRHAITLTVIPGLQTLVFVLEPNPQVDMNNDAIKSWGFIHSLESLSPTDSDQDKVPDSLEYFLYGSTYRYNQADIQESDTDGDGLTDWQELVLKSLVTSEDTDNDGLPDGWEHRHGLLLFENNFFQDSDNDQATDYEEWLQGSDPTVAGDAHTWIFNTGSLQQRGFYFWPAKNGYGDFAETVSGYWQRTHNRLGQKVLRSYAHLGGNRQSCLATYLDPIGAKALITYSKSKKSDFYIYQQPVADDLEAMFNACDDCPYTLLHDRDVERAYRQVVLDLNTEPQRLVFCFGSVGTATDYIDLHNLLLPAIPDTDDDGVSDAFEHIHMGSLLSFSPRGIRLR